MRFVFTTLQHTESQFYGSVGFELERLGHEVAHVAYSREAAQRLRRRGARAASLLERMAELPAFDVTREAARVEATYGLPSLHWVYRTDPACSDAGEGACVERTVRHFLALESLLDDYKPEAIVPEVGRETIRTAAHVVGLTRQIPVWFLFLTIFPEPLRLYRDTMHGPIVPQEAVRPLTSDEEEKLDRFIADYTTRRSAIRQHLAPTVRLGKLRELGRHVAVKAIWDRDNEYLRPGWFVTNYFRKKARAAWARHRYRELDPERPFVYFPIHVVDDYKIERVIPHCRDQAALIEQVAAALPEGVDLVTKEHPLSIGRTPRELVTRLTRIPNVRLVDPYTSSHDLIERSCAVAVISSTVGLEALLYGKPVLTLGQPFYCGFGVTIDVDDFRAIEREVPRLIKWQPDEQRIRRFLGAAMRACLPGKPVLVDSSEENARTLAASLDRAVAAGRAAGAVSGPSPSRSSAPSMR